MEYKEKDLHHISPVRPTKSPNMPHFLCQVSYASSNTCCHDYYLTRHHIPHPLICMLGVKTISQKLNLKEKKVIFSEAVNARLKNIQKRTLNNT